MDYDSAKHYIRAISRMDKRGKECFFTSDTNVQNHHVISVWRLARFIAGHPQLSPEDIPIPIMPVNEHMHKIIHQFQDENGHPRKPTEQDCLFMWIQKEQLRAKQRDIQDIFDNEWIDSYTDEIETQIERIEDNLDRYHFEISEEYLQDYFIEKEVVKCQEMIA